MTHNELAQKIFTVSYITGNFKLRSGQTSSEYFDKYRFESHPELLKEIAKKMIPLIPSGTDALAGLEMGGIPIATALALQCNIPLVFVRKKAKEYGTCQVAEGYNVQNKSVLIIEDVITSGGQVVSSAQDLRKLGARVQNVLCVIDRSLGNHKQLEDAQISLSALFTMEELKTYR